MVDIINSLPFSFMLAAIFLVIIFFMIRFSSDPFVGYLSIVLFFLLGFPCWIAGLVPLLIDLKAGKSLGKFRATLAVMTGIPYIFGLLTIIIPMIMSR